MQELPICTATRCDLSGQKREVGPCKFFRVVKDDVEECSPY